jgi:hypothetical protein
MLATVKQTNVLQEYADSRGVALKVDRERGVIRGVKLLGTESAKGRSYPLDVLRRAAPKYEGVRVNVDHVDPGARRSYRDRLGTIRNVVVRQEGLFGDFHYNPKHALAEQLAWDAEHAPQNVGFSHDARGPSKLKGGKVVVESIDQVLSVDLVANPATSGGLYEDTSGAAKAPRPAPAPTLPPRPFGWHPSEAELISFRRRLATGCTAGLRESADAAPAPSPATFSFLRRPTQAECVKFRRSIAGAR